MQNLKTFECTFKYSDGEEVSELIVAKSHSKARYAFYRRMDSDYSYKSWFKHIKVKSVGPIKKSDLYEDLDKLTEVCRRRGIPWVRMGMTIDVDGKKGIVVGGNSSLNLNVVFEGTTDSKNCHPTWETTYFNEDGTIFQNYKQRK